jgi:hypothetical protein
MNHILIGISKDVKRMFAIEIYMDTDSKTAYHHPNSS